MLKKCLYDVNIIKVNGNGKWKKKFLLVNKNNIDISCI